MTGRDLLDQFERLGAAMSSEQMRHLEMLAGTSCRLVKPSLAETIREARERLIYRSADSIDDALISLAQMRRALRFCEALPEADAHFAGIEDDFDAMEAKLQAALAVQHKAIEAIETQNEEVA